MDKLAKYQECVQSLLTRYAKEDVADSEVEVQLIFDEKRDHYSVDECGMVRFKACLSLYHSF